MEMVAANFACLIACFSLAIKDKTLQLPFLFFLFFAIDTKHNEEKDRLVIKAILSSTVWPIAHMGCA